MSRKSVGRLRQMYRDIRHTLNIRKHEKTAAKVLVGDDEHGNKYYKQEGDAARNIKSKRFVEALDPDQSLVPRVPIHWDAWLRGRRDDPPSAEEVARVTERVERGRAMSAQVSADSVKDHIATPADAATPFPRYDDLHDKAGYHKPD